MGAIAAPVIIHMMMRRRVRRMKWAAMRFLLPVVQKNERRLRVEDLILLLLRCLLLVLLALALARPAFRTAGMPVGGGARTVVIALDNSIGMGLSDGGSSRFDNGRKAARQIIDNLPPGSSAAFLLFSDVARPVIAEPAADLNLVRKMIAEAPLTDRGSNIHPALDAALDILQRRNSDQGTIYLITGGQATGWKELASMRSDLAKTGAQVTVVIPGPGEQPNLGLSDLALGSPLVADGVAARFSIEATNYGREDASNVTIGLSIDGQPPCDQAVIGLVPAGGSRRVSLFGKTVGAGYHTVTAQLPPDHLTADDRRTIVVRSVEEVGVLLVAGDMGVTPSEGDAFFLERALAPVAPEDRDNYFIKTKVISAADLPSVKLADFNAVALVNVPEVDQDIVTALDEFVREGGGLMIFPGDKTDAPAINLSLGQGLGMLPAAMGDPWGDATGQGTFKTLQPSGYTHPMVSIWQDPASGTLTSARFFKGLTLQPMPKQGSQAGQAETILNYSDGSPAIVERTWGRGRVIEFSSTANTAWNDLPAHPAFVPLMQRALGRLVTRRDEALNIPVGAPLELSARPEWLYKEMTVTPPGAAPGAGDKSTVALIDGAPLLRYEDTDHAGAYTLDIASEPPAKMLFAAQPDPAQSNLEPIPDEELESLGPGTEVVHWTPQTDLRQGLAGSGDDQELWMVLAVLALGVAGCESFLAGRFSAAK
jgi:hypothetical protein